MMRRTSIASLVVLAVLALTAAPVGASPSSSLNRKVSGPFAGTSVFDFQTHGCSFVFQTFDASFGVKTSSTGKPGSASFHLEGCVEITGGNPSIVFDGTFTLTTRNHAVLTGSAISGPDVAPGPCASGIAVGLNIVMTLESGTKQFRDATGDIGLRGTWCSPAAPNTPGPISGQLTGDLTHTH